MKLKILFAFLFITIVTTSISFAQSKPSFTNTINHEYYDGQLYLKLKNEVNLTLPDYDEKDPVEYSSDFSNIIEQFRIYSIHKAFPVLKSVELQHTYKILFHQKTDVEQLIKVLQSLSIVDFAEKVPVRTTNLTPNDPGISSQYALTKINAFNAWNLSTGSVAIKVAIVDDEVKFTHQDLGPNKWINPGEIAGNGIDDDGDGYIDDVNGYDVADGDPDPNPPSSATNSSFSHGTHCSGIADGASNNALGIASVGYGLSLIGVKCDPDNTSNPNQIDFAMEGVAYAIAAHADVISMSWGGGGFSQTEQNVFNTAWTQGIVLCAAAGNDGADETFYPAQYDHILSVGSTGTTDAKSSFSNYGTWVDVMAPGENIYSTLAGSNNSYGNYSGTSMATPMVAGLCGLIKAMNPSYSNTQIISCLQSSCDNIDAQNSAYIGKIGSGRINAYAALVCANPNVAPIAAFTSTTPVACSGSITFADQSTNNPTQWLWHFGDGATSASQNPTHTYLASGTYSVTLTATNSFGSNTVTVPNSVTISLPTAPVAPSVSRCGAGTVTLNASGNGTLNWYTAASGGSPFTTGTTYTTPSLNATATYYVESNTVPAPAFGGLPNNSSGTGGYFSNSTDRYEIFNCTQPCTLVSTVVYASGAGNRTIQLRNSSGTVLQSLVVNLVDGQNTVTLNFSLPVGNDMELAIGGTSNLYRNQSGAVYPYNIGSSVSITNSNSGTAGYYYYFYNWKIQEPGCISTRTAVQAIITPTPTSAITAGGVTTFCAGLNVVLTNTSTGFSYQWKKGTANISGATNSTYTATVTGSYTCIASNTCGSVTSNAISVTRLAVPTAVITLTGNNPFCKNTTITLTASSGTGVTYQWKRNNVNIAGATNQILIVSTGGNYRVVVTKTSTGCSKTSAQKSLTTVVCREEESILGSTIQVYPNPFTNTVTLQFSSFKPDRIEVIDIAGRVVEIKSIGELSSVQLGENLPSGFYVARLWNGNELMQNIKLLKSE